MKLSSQDYVIIFGRHNITFMIFNFILSLFLVSGYVGKHDIHISKCDIKYNTEVPALQITVHIYIDDLEESLTSDGIEKLHILTEKESADADYHIENYINKHLVIKADGEELSAVYLGKEISEDFMAAWCYLEVSGVEGVEDIEISYDALMELYDDQRNIVTIKKDEERKAYLLFDKESYTETVSLR